MAVFDPLFITYQIVAMQSLYYLAMGTLWGLYHVVFDSPVSLDHFFTPKYVNFITAAGLIEFLCSLSTALVGYDHYY